MHSRNLRESNEGGTEFIRARTNENPISQFTPHLSDVHKEHIFMDLIAVFNASILIENVKALSNIGCTIPIYSLILILLYSYIYSLIIYFLRYLVVIFNSNETITCFLN